MLDCQLRMLGGSEPTEGGLGITESPGLTFLVGESLPPFVQITLPYLRPMFLLKESQVHGSGSLLIGRSTLIGMAITPLLSRSDV
jgi:hypothetical protein